MNDSGINNVASTRLLTRCFFPDYHNIVPTALRFQNKFLIKAPKYKLPVLPKTTFITPFI